MSDMSAVLQFVKQQAGASAAGGVWPGAAPPGVANPHATVVYYGGKDVMVVAGIRLFSTSNWLIEFWGPDSNFAAVEAAYATADAALQRAKHVYVADGQILSCVRTQPRLNFAIVDGAQWVRLGGVYEIETVSP